MGVYDGLQAHKHVYKQVFQDKAGEFRGADGTAKDIGFYLYEKYPLLGILWLPLQQHSH